MLSDELIKIGMQANPRSNISMGEQAQRMLDRASEEFLHNVQYDMRKMLNVFKYVCNELNKMGFSYYKPELFFYDKQETKITKTTKA